MCVVALTENVLLRHVARSPDLHLSDLTLSVWRKQQGPGEGTPASSSCPQSRIFRVANLQVATYYCPRKTNTGSDRGDVDFGGENHHRHRLFFCFVRGYAEVKKKVSVAFECVYMYACGGGRGSEQTWLTAWISSRCKSASVTDGRPLIAGL